MSEVMISIKKGNNEFVRTLRSNLVTVEPTHDGIVFTLKEGIQIYITDQYMPVYTKDIMKNTSNSFTNADLIFDLANYQKPVVAQVNK
jgi:hypothetical protein